MAEYNTAPVATVETAPVAKRKPGRPRKNPTITEVVKAQAEVPAAATPVKVKDPLDKKLDYFQYNRDPNAAEPWESENPMDTPQIRKIKAEYPNLRFHFVSQRNLELKGKDYHGWQLFSDTKRPNGLKVGNDLFLAAMPEEMAQQYNEHTAYRSTERVRGLQENQMETIAQIEAQKGAMGISEVSGTGITVGSVPKFTRQIAGRPIAGGGYSRGYTREEVHEMAIKQREARAKARSYSIPGVRPSG